MSPPPSQQLRLLLGDGAGGFGPPTNISYSGPCPSGPNCIGGAGQIRAGDINNDGNLDLAFNSSSEITGVILGSGDGTFGPGTAYVNGERAIALGDLNNDGYLDLIGGGANGQNMIRLNNGDGDFIQWSRTDIEVADVDGDGDQDVLVGNVGTINVLLNTGDGTFSKLPNIVFSAGSLAVGDFDRDGFPDMAITSGDGMIRIFLGVGDGTFSAPTNFAAGASPTNITVADFDGDGNLDLAVSNSVNHYVSILEGDGAGSFGAPTNYPDPIDLNVLHTPVQVMADDLNGDGQLDIAVMSSANDKVVVILNTTPVLRCNGLTPTIVGTEGDDHIVGTSGDDVIASLGGDDTVLGRGGNDTICLGDGADFGDGGAGGDWIAGENGNDDLWGRRGRDRLIGGKGYDLLRGGWGNDRLFGGGGDDVALALTMSTAEAVLIQPQPTVKAW